MGRKKLVNFHAYTIIYQKLMKHKILQNREYLALIQYFITIAVAFKS